MSLYLIARTHLPVVVSPPASGVSHPDVRVRLPLLRLKPVLGRHIPTLCLGSTARKRVSHRWKQHQ